jgi:serine/threonine protein kinase
LADQGPKDFGEYKVVRRIGKGGFGAVYLAENRLFPDHLFAVKAFNRTEDDGGASQYLDELTNVIRLSHSNIVQVRGFGIEDREGEAQPYIVMDFIEGPNGGSYNLKQHLRARGGKLSPGEAKHLFKQILTALAVVHEKRIAHLDLKPENILLDRGLNAYISDFGVSRTITSKSVMLKDGPVIQGFSPYYASPEQIRHAYGSRHSDIFSLGIILVECLTGQRPEILHSKSEPKVETIRLADQGLDPKWDTLVEHCLSIDPAYRFPNASVFLRALRQIPVSESERESSYEVSPPAMDSEPEIVPPTTPPRRATPAPMPMKSDAPTGRMAQLLEISERKLREQSQPPKETAPPKRNKGLLYRFALLLGVLAGTAVGAIAGMNVGDEVGRQFSKTLGEWAGTIAGVPIGGWIGEWAGVGLGALLGGTVGCLLGYLLVAWIGRWTDSIATLPEEEEELP